MSAGVQSIAFLDDKGSGRKIDVEKLSDHLQNLAVADYLYVGVAKQQLRKRRRMVGLHVLDDHEVEMSARQPVRKILEKRLAHGLVHRVEKHVDVVF